MDTITVPSSVFVNGQWATAHWMADVVDESTGELVITATLAGEAGQGPVVTALRMNMDLARQLRAMAGFVPGETLEADEPCYDCRTTQQRVSELERELHAINHLLNHVCERLDELEADKVPVANGQWMGEIEQRLDDLVLRAVSETTHVALMKRVDALETKNASATVHLNQVPNAVKRINELDQLLQAVIKDCVEIERRMEELGHQVGLLQAEHVTPADVQRDRDWLSGLTVRLGALETLNLHSRVAYLERQAQGINGVDAGL